MGNSVPFDNDPAQLERSALPVCVRLLARPLINFCLRHSVKMQDLVECLKSTYVEAAESQLRQAGVRVTDSRISAATGLHRRDVVRLRHEKAAEPDARDLIMRVIGQWQGSSQFITAKGKPRILTIGFDGCEFNALVRSVSKDLNPATVRFEMARLKAVEETPRGVKLRERAYVPVGDAVSGIALIAKDSADLLEAGEQNVLSSGQAPNHHLRTAYDKVRAENLDKINDWIWKEGELFHARAREFISKFDQDINPDPGYSGPFSKVILGSFGKVDKES